MIAKRPKTIIVVGSAEGAYVTLLLEQYLGGDPDCCHHSYPLFSRGIPVIQKSSFQEEHHLISSVSQGYISDFYC